MADYLNTIYLYRDVKITRDYSVVHDLTPGQWFNYLKAHGTQVDVEDVNYYRVPSVIRIEGVFNNLRKATYGMFFGKDQTDGGVTNPTLPYYFFWVDEVRLVKQGSQPADNQDPPVYNKDVVELVISPDVWSNKWTDAKVTDTYVERMHVKRWDTSTTPPTPYYYPDAGQGVDGAYELESETDLDPATKLTASGIEYEVRTRFICVSAVDTSGNLKLYVSPYATARYEAPGVSYDLYYVYYVTEGDTWRGMGPDHLFDGTMFAAMGITASYVQSVFVLDELPGESGFIDAYVDNNDMIQVRINASHLTSRLDMACRTTTHNGEKVFWMEYNTPSVSGMALMGNDITKSVTPVAPSYNASPTAYDEKMEPMLFRSPARIRRLTSGIGGNLVDIPDLRAFDTSVTTKNMVDVNTAVTFVFMGDDIRKANAEGCLASSPAPTLPIYSSAWREYEAISKAGDEMAFNAQQMSALANGVTNATLGVGMGVMSGGPAGGILSAIGAVVGSGVNMWANDESFRAKQLTIRNSPSVVKSGGSGLAAIMKDDLVDIFYTTLKIDSKSYDALKTQYHYYGYFIRKMVPGDVKSKMSTRKYFNFVETKGARVSGNLNAADSQQIAAILDRGVTIYHGTDGYAQIGTGMALENYEV